MATTYDRASSVSLSGPPGWTRNARLSLLPIALLPATIGALAVLTLLVGAPTWVPVALGMVHFVTQLMALSFFGILNVRDQHIPTLEKVFWSVFLLAAAPAAAPVFWFIRIWNAESAVERAGMGRAIARPVAVAHAAAA